MTEVNNMTEQPLSVQINNILNLINTEKNSEAVTALLSATQAHPQESGLVFLLASVYCTEGKYEEAIQHFERCLSLTPEMGIARFQLGFLLVNLNQFEKALVHFSLLHKTTEEAYLKNFSQAFIALLANNNEQVCIEQLQLGITENQENIALNDDMKKVIELLLAEDATSNTTELDEAAEQSNTSSNLSTSALLNIYNPEQ